LQNALDILSKSNRLEVIHYPTKEQTRAYAGNGLDVATLLVPDLFPTFMPDQLEQELSKLLEGCESLGGDLLISSEDFFSAASDRFDYLKTLLSKYARNIKLIVVVRPIDSWVYSYYMQMVKRHGASSGFTAEWLSQFEDEVFEKFRSVEKFAVDTLILPYSNSGLLKSFFGLIGESDELAAEIPDVRVNRSLSQRELKLLERVNSTFGCERLSGLISDEFIRIDTEGCPEPISVDSAAFYLEFRHSLQDKISSLDTKLMQGVENALFSDVDEHIFTPAVQSVVSDEQLVSSMLAMIKRWMDEGGDLFRIRNYAAKNLNPTKEFFDPVHYLVMNRDVLRLGLDPWGHYQKNGRGEGRNSAYVRADIDI
jgi:hypothetical protein